MPAAPKPQKPIRGTAASRAHMAAVAQLPCVICAEWPVIVHHCISGRFGQGRASDFDTIPLCARHHDATSPEGIHANKRDWEKMHGPDTGFLPRVHAMLGLLYADAEGSA